MALWSFTGYIVSGREDPLGPGKGSLELTHKVASLNEVGDVIVRDEETMLALANIERYRLVEVLRRRGQSSSAELAVHLGESPADVEAALYRLASVGLVSTASVAIDDKEPLWEAVGRGIFLDAPDDPKSALPV